MGNPDRREKSFYVSLYSFFNCYRIDALISGKQGIVSEAEKSGKRGKNMI